MQSYKLATTAQSYRLATETETGAIVTFGPAMARNVAERKRADLLKLVNRVVYVVNINAE